MTCPNIFYTLNFLGIRDCSFKQRQLKLLKGAGLRLEYRQMLPFAALSCSESPLPDDMMQEVGDGWGASSHPHQWVWGLCLTGKQTEALRFIPCPRCLSQGNSRPWTPIQPSWCPSLSTRRDHRPPHHSPLFPEHLGPQPCQAPRSLQPTRWAHLGRSGRWEVKIITLLHRLGSGLRDPARAMKCRGWAAGLSPEPLQPRISFP